MLLFSKDNIFYRQCGFFLMLLQLWLFIFAMPPFQYGIWTQTEPVMLALFCTAALNCLWLLFGLTKKYLCVQSPHPIFICLLLWISWQIVATLGASNSWRSWFGSGQNGEGTGEYVAFLLQFMVIYPLWHNLSSRRILIEAALAGLAAQSLLHWAFPPDQDWHYAVGGLAPAEWAAYLAFMVAPLWLALLAGGYIKTISAYATIIAFFIIVLIISANKSALVLLPAAMFFSLFIFASPKKNISMRRFFYPSRRWRLTSVAMCLLPLLWIAFSAYYPAFPNSGPEIFSKKDGPISSRLVFNKVAISTMQHEPSRLFMGEGWGRFSDDLFKYVLVDGVTVFKDGKRNPNWFMIDGQTFHSHNQILEALLSLGLPGMLLWFALPMAAIIYMPKRYFWACAPMVVAQVILSSLWFELAQCMPYQALGWVALICHRHPALVAGSGYRNKCGMTLITILLFVMTWSACQQQEAMLYGDKLYKVIETKEYKNYNLDWIEKDISRGGERLRASAMGYAKILSKRDAIDESDLYWFAQYLQALHDASLSPHVGARVASSEVKLQYALLLEIPFPLMANLGHQAVLSLPDSLIRLYARAPLRDDMTDMYLLNLPGITHGDNNRQLKILSKMHDAMPGNRAVLWALGDLLRKTPGSEAEGQAMCTQAVNRGVEQVYSVSK